jgi:hypothetical protein
MQTNTPLLKEERGGAGALEHVRPPSAKDQGSGRSSFRSSKLYLLTALTNHFITMWL